MTTTTTPLRWHGNAAQDTAFVYAVIQQPDGWLLEVRRLVRAVGTSYRPGPRVIADALLATPELARAVAQSYSDLGLEYLAYQHGGNSRIVTAVQNGNQP